MKWSTNPLVWLANFCYAWPKKLLNYPKVLVLEMGSDKPGDLAHLTSIVRPDIAVITTIGIAHLEKFGTSDAIFNEKIQLFKQLAPNGLAIANLDDANVREAYNQHSGKKFSFGTEEAELRARDIKKSGQSTLFSVQYRENADQASIPFFGKPAVLAALAAYAVGLNLGLSLQKISKGLENWQHIPGRMNVYQIGKVCLLDDCYNANPQSVNSALETLKETEAARRWAVLGDMLELGALEYRSHENCAKRAAEVADKVILVGERYLKVIDSLPKEKVHWCPGAELAAIKVRNEVKSYDAILVKGSNKMHMHKIVEALKEAHA